MMRLISRLLNIGAMVAYKFIPSTFPICLGTYITDLRINIISLCYKSSNSKIPTLKVSPLGLTIKI